MVMDIREATELTILLIDDDGRTVFEITRGHYIAVADKRMSVIVPGELLKKFKTRFFLIQERQGEIILTPARLKLELMENDESALSSPRTEKRSVLRDNLGSHEKSPKLMLSGEM